MSARNLKVPAGQPLPAYCEPYMLRSFYNRTTLHLVGGDAQFPTMLCGRGGDEWDRLDRDTEDRVLCGDCARIAQSRALAKQEGES